MNNMKHKILSLLVLLLTAATGAWAQGAFSSDPYTSTTEFNSVSVKSSMTLNINEGVIVTVNSGLTIEDGVTLTLTGGGRLSVYGKSGAWGRDAFYEEGNRIVEATAGGDGNPAIILNDNAKIVIDNGEIYAEGGQGGFGGTDETAGINQPDGAAGNAFSRFPTIDGATLYYKSSSEWIKYTSGNQTLYNKMKAVPATFEVTIDNSLEQPTASFQMPQYDVTASYTLKRDMSVDMPVTVQDAEQNSRFRVKKQGDTFVPADMNMEQIVALFTVHDDIEEKNLTANTDFTVQLFAVNEEGQKTGEAIPFNDFTFAPGNYVATAVAASNSNYSGETALSNVFTLFQGYEITVPAGEYISYYQSEALYVEDEDAVLYTIANVTATEAQLSDAIKVAPAETPLLVYNKSEQDKTFLLIPTTENADEVTPAKEFKGSLTEGEIPASSAVTDYYALNGKAFVWVKYAIEIGANKCWLQIGDQPAAARAMTRSITGGGDTTNMDDVRWQMEDGNYYDLQGRKVEKPNRKGIYIKNGQKVIVR